ncbi:MAG TPA: hypothetical protein VKD90_30515 [Gemmataceae bacterium]|nr:hypothetical protein [Gemmataceae bacterium]
MGLEGRLKKLEAAVPGPRPVEEWSHEWDAFFGILDALAGGPSTVDTLRQRGVEQRWSRRGAFADALRFQVEAGYVRIAKGHARLTEKGLRFLDQKDNVPLTAADLDMTFTDDDRRVRQPDSP